MSSARSILLTTAIVLSMLFTWTLLTPESATTATQSTQQSINSQSIKALLKRIDSLENELADEQSRQQQQELRLSALEQQQPIKTPANDLIVIKDEGEIESPVRTSIKPPTLQDKLLSAMIPLDTIQRIQQQVGENRLARLQLRDQAIREDWIDTPEYIEQQQQLPSPTAGLREQFGDQIYDRYLYVSGRPNRVIVREVFSGSAASEAGIEPNDIILSYASEAVYTMSDLQQATTEGIAGEAVLIEIQRDELPFSTSAPRGPLGISMTIMRQQPQ